MFYFWGVATIYFGVQVLRILPTLLRLFRALVEKRVKWPGPVLLEQKPRSGNVRTSLGINHKTLFSEFLWHTLAVVGAFGFSILSLVNTSQSMVAYREGTTFCVTVLVSFLLLGALFSSIRVIPLNAQINNLLSDFSRGVEPQQISAQTAEAEYAIEYPLLRHQALTPDNKRALNLFYESSLLVQAGNHQKAAITYQQALTLDPDLHKRAVEILKNMQQDCSPKDAAPIYYWLGIHSEYQMNLTEASIWYDKAASAYGQAGYKNRQARALCNYGSVLGKSGDLSRAMENFEKAVALNPRNGTAHFNIGMMCYRISDAGSPEYKRAIDAFANAIEADPEVFIPIVTERMRSHAYSWKEDLDEVSKRVLNKRFPIVEESTPRSFLSQDHIIQAIKNDLAKTGQIGYKETWRFGLITPDLDRYDPRPNGLSRKESFGKVLTDHQYKLNSLGRLPLKCTAILNRTHYFNVVFEDLAITNGLVESLVPGTPLKIYKLNQKLEPGEYVGIRHIQMADSHIFLPGQLREAGFPLKTNYADGDPLTTARGGIIVSDHGEIRIIHPNYFVQRQLIDDEGNLVHMGLDEDFQPSTMFDVKMQPSVSQLLLRCVDDNHYKPILRYQSFPYDSDYMLPILDTPMSCNGWADLYIDTRGKAKLFVAKEKTTEEWYELMEKLRQLFYSELAKKDYHLLGLTKDTVHLNQYLSEKQKILEDYFSIEDWQIF